jgi:hypothetical protein
MINALLINFFYIDLANENNGNRRESVKINIEGLPSLRLLHLGANSTQMSFSIRNLISLKYLSLSINCTIDENILTQLLDQVQHIEQLFLNSINYKFSHFSLDRLVNLKKLSLLGGINESFNFEFFKNLCNQLEEIYITIPNIDDKTFVKLFDGHNFSNLQSFVITKYNIKTLKKEFINRFPMLRKLFILDCNIEEIEHDAFSNSKQLYCLDLSHNRLKFIQKDTFSDLKNLKILDLSINELRNLDIEFIGVKNYVKMYLDNKGYETFYHYHIG